MGWDSRGPQGVYGTGVWKGILSVLEVFRNYVVMLNKSIINKGMSNTLVFQLWKYNSKDM